MARGVDNRHTSTPGRREQPLGGRDGLPGVLAAGAGEFLINLFDRAIPAQIGLVVEVDGQNGWIVADVNSALVGLIDLQRVGVDNVLPAVVFEIASHRGAPALNGRRKPRACLVPLESGRAADSLKMAPRKKGPTCVGPEAFGD